MQSVTLIADEQCVDFAKEFNEKILQMQQSGEYWITDMGYQIGEDLWKLKEASGMKYKDIAAKLGKSKKWYGWDKEIKDIQTQIDQAIKTTYDGDRAICRIFDEDYSYSLIKHVLEAYEGEWSTNIRRVENKAEGLEPHTDPYFEIILE